MLRDELRIGQTPDQRMASETYGRENSRNRTEIESHIKEYLSKGGKVDEVAINVSKGTLKRFTIDLKKDVL
jgi:hypothetical protein